jgi:hypothetical protein
VIALGAMRVERVDVVGVVEMTFQNRFLWKRKKTNAALPLSKMIR